MFGAEYDVLLVYYENVLVYDGYCCHHLDEKSANKVAYFVLFYRFFLLMIVFHEFVKCTLLFEPTPHHNSIVVCFPIICLLLIYMPLVTSIIWC